MAVRNYRDLVVWQEAMDLVMLVYRVTAHFPPDELYGLRSQIRRAAVSVPSNIAEGEGRRMKREFRRFLLVAHGSLRELETQMLIASRLHYVKDAETGEVLDLAGRIGRRTLALVNSLHCDK
jgi:four helix bundle protein